MANEMAITVGNRSRTVPIPESWDDLEAKTFLLFYDTLFSGLGDEYTSSTFTMVKLITMTQRILGVDSGWMTFWENDCIKNDPQNGQAIFLEELQQVLHTALAGLFDVVEDEDGGNSYACKLNRTRNLWPSISFQPKARGKKATKAIKWLYAPADKLANLTIYELGMSFSMFDAYLATGDMQHVDRLIATLYRPSKTLTKSEMDSAWQGDRRLPLRKHEGAIEERIKLVQGMATLVKRVILFWFASCRSEIVAQYPKVFKKADSGDKGGGYGWGGVWLSLAENGALGNLDEVCDQHYSNALTFLSMKEDQAREMEKKMAKKK